MPLWPSQESWSSGSHLGAIVTHLGHLFPFICPILGHLFFLFHWCSIRTGISLNETQESGLLQQELIEGLRELFIQKDLRCKSCLSRTDRYVSSEICFQWLVENISNHEFTQTLRLVPIIPFHWKHFDLSAFILLDISITQLTILFLKYSLLAKTQLSPESLLHWLVLPGLVCEFSSSSQQSNVDFPSTPPTSF